jgi:hypothetical protein
VVGTKNRADNTKYIFPYFVKILDNFEKKVEKEKVRVGFEAVAILGSQVGGRRIKPSRHRHPQL